MKVAITSTVILEVDDAPLDKLARDFKSANVWAIGRQMETVSGRPYVLRAIERFEVEPR